MRKWTQSRWRRMFAGWFVGFVVGYLLLAGGNALAQSIGQPSFDPVGWGTNPFSLAAVVALVIATLKRGVEQRAKKDNRVLSNPWLWRGVALLLGQAGAWGLYLSNYGAELRLYGLISPWSVFWYGALASLIGMGGRDFLKTVVEWFGFGVTNALPGQPAQQPFPSSLPDTHLSPLPDGEVLPPDGVIGAPPGQESPVLQPSGLPGQAQGFLGGQLAAAGLGLLIETVLRNANVSPTTETVARVAARLARVAPDLLDGDLHLSATNRGRVLGVVMELKQKGELS